VWTAERNTFLIHARFFDRLFRRCAVAYQHYVILEGADLDGTPGDFLDHSGVSLRAYCNHIAHLEWPVECYRLRFWLCRCRTETGRDDKVLERFLR